MAFWLVGLASPVLIYALDIWEHTLGLAAMGWGVVMILDVAHLDMRRSGTDSSEPGRQGAGSERDPQAHAGVLKWRAALFAGALFGLAASMRTEAIVYFVTSVGIGCAALGWPRMWRAPLRVAALALVGFCLLFLANIGLELAVLGEPFRSNRATGAASVAGQDLLVRAKESMTTLFSLAPTLDLEHVLYGFCFAAGIGLFVMSAIGKVPKTIGYLALAGSVLAMLDRVTLGSGFWPGLFATTPVAAAGLFLGWSPRPRRWVLVMGLLPLPLVFVFQFPGGAAPQWGGRYILLSGLLLEVVGFATLAELGRSTQQVLMGMAIVVTVMGLAWSSQRTHEVARAGEILSARPEAVLISPQGFPPREFGATWGAKDWLSTQGRSDVPGAIDNGHNNLSSAVDLVRRSGKPSFAIVTTDTSVPFPEFPGFREVSREQVPLIGGLEFTVISYVRA